MSRCKPAKNLSNLRPTGHIFGPRVLTNLGASLAIFGGFFSFCYFYSLTLTDDWWIHMSNEELKIPFLMWTKHADNFLSPMSMIFMIAQIATVGYVMCYGREHRRSAHRNFGLLLVYLVILAFCVLLILGGPSDLHCLMRTNCDSETSVGLESSLIRAVSTGGI